MAQHIVSQAAGCLAHELLNSTRNHKVKISGSYFTDQLRGSFPGRPQTIDWWEENSKRFGFVLLVTNSQALNVIDWKF